MPVTNDQDTVFMTEILPVLTSDMAYSKALRMMRNPTDAEDLVQRASMRAWRFRHSFTAGTCAKAWVATIIRNEGINVINSKRADRQEFGRDTDYLAVDHFDMEASIDDAAEAREAADLVRRGLQKVRPDYRDAVVAYAMYDLSYREIAEAQGCPIGTVMSRIYRGRKQLRNAVAELH